MRAVTSGGALSRGVAGGREGGGAVESLFLIKDDQSGEIINDVVVTP